MWIVYCIVVNRLCNIVEPSRNESYVRISTVAENGLLVIQTKNVTLPLFSTNAIFGMLVVSWQLSYCIFCIKRVILKPIGKSYLDIYIRKLNFKCILLSFYFRLPADVYVAVTSSSTDQSSWNMHQIKAEWLMFHIMYVTQLFCFETYYSFCYGSTFKFVLLYNCE